MPRITMPEEIEEMSDRIDQESGLLVQDRDSFDLAFSNITEIKDADLSSKQLNFRDDVFRRYLQQHPAVRPDRLFKKARGKDLEKDRKTTEPIVKSDKEFIRRGARRFDFAGFDVKLPATDKELTPKQRQKLIRDVRTRKEFVIPATVKKKVVFARKTFVVVKGKEQVRFRDSLGRFASIR